MCIQNEFMKVLLIAPPKRRLAGSEEHPPLGLGYLATMLRSIGCDPDIKDCIINDWDTEQILNYLWELEPDVIGIQVFSQAVPYVNQILDRIKAKRPGIITIVGGPHPTAIPEETLNHIRNADYGIAGEGEISMQYLMQYLRDGSGSLEDIPGLIYRDNGRMKWNSKIEHRKIEDFGFPAWDIIGPQRYFSARGIGARTAVIHTSRGCPFNCQFCVRLGKTARYRSIEHVYEEILLLHNQYGIIRFNIGDEGFPINPKYVKEFCRYIIKKGNNFSFFAGTGLRLSVLDSEMLELMKEANFERVVGVGIESGAQHIRDLMKKSLTQEQLFRGIELLNRHGFRPAGNFIIGYPGETKKDIEETIRMALKLKIWGAAFSPFAPLPGSDATKRLIENGELPNDFDFTRIDLDSVLYAPRGMTIKEVDSLRKKAVFRFNCQPRMLWYHLTGGRLFWTIIKASRIFLPHWLVPKRWRRITTHIEGNK